MRRATFTLRSALPALLTLVGTGPEPPPAESHGGRVIHPAIEDEAPFPRGGLLREGSYLLGVEGTLQRGADGWWTFRALPDTVERQHFSELTALPSTLLASLEQLVSSLPDDEIIFELSGRIFVYHDRNYLLPTHAPRLAGYVPTRREDADTPEADSAERILGDLDRAVGPVPRSPGETAASADASGAPQLVPAGTVLLWRRGWMVREADSAWSFVFEADASGESDPPMTLLPCLLLEDMETHAQEQGPRRALVVCGRVFRYHARNYLLPTAFQIARENTVRP